jgi:hypothetical protein
MLDADRIAQLRKKFTELDGVPEEAQSDKNFTFADLRGRDFSGQDLSGANFFGAKLQNANFQGATLNDAEFTGADLTGANFEGATAERAGFGKAVLTGACFFSANLKAASFIEANLKKADLRCANLEGARLRQANLDSADLSNANLHSAELSLANVRRASFNNADLRNSRLRLVRNFASASWIGVDIRDVHFAGAYRLRRFIVDQNYLKEYRESDRLSALFYFFWKITSNCGRSMTLWFLWIIVLGIFFGFIYMFVGIDYGEYPTWFSPFYYSLVTLTTLGYGDIVPKTVAGQIVAMIEVIIGYLMLGGLVSIMSNKFARRGE